MYSIYSKWIYLNGFLHCICTHRERTLEFSIVSFDVESEHFQLLPIPEYHIGQMPAAYRLELGVSDGRLYVTVAFKEKIVVWVMKDYGIIKESWISESLKLETTLIN